MTLPKPYCVKVANRTCSADHLQSPIATTMMEQEDTGVTLNEDPACSRSSDLFRGSFGRRFCDGKKQSDQILTAFSWSAIRDRKSGQQDMHTCTPAYPCRRVLYWRACHKSPLASKMEIEMMLCSACSASQQRWVKDNSTFPDKSHKSTHWDPTKMEVLVRTLEAFVRTASSTFRFGSYSTSLSNPRYPTLPCLAAGGSAGCGLNRPW